MRSSSFLEVLDRRRSRVPAAAARESGLAIVNVENLKKLDRPLTWVVKIRPGIEFHNGKTVTVDDVIFRLQRILDPKTAARRRDRARRHQEHQEARRPHGAVPLK